MCFKDDHLGITWGVYLDYRPQGPLRRPSKSVSRKRGCKSAIKHTPQGLLHSTPRLDCRCRQLKRIPAWNEKGPPGQPPKLF